MATEMGYGNRPPQAVDRFMKYALSIFLIVSCLFFSGKAHAASLLNITHKSDGGHTSVMLEFDSPVKFAERFVDAPSRLYLDVKQPTSATVTKSYRIESGIISAVRAGRFDKNTLRVVFDLGSMYARHIISTLSDPYRVVVDLYADNVADTENKTRTAAVEAVKAAETPKPQPPAMPVTTQPPVSAQPMPQGAGGLVPLPPALRPGTASAPGPNAAVPSLDNKTASQAAPALMPSPQLSAPPPPPASSKAAKPLVQHAGPNNVSLAFDDADIYEIAHTVFGEILKVNYLIDSRVKGRITFKTVSPIANSDVLPVMSTIFRLNGVSIMEEHGLYRIIPLTDISKEPVGVNFGKDSGDMRIRGFSMIQIVPLNSIGSKDMVEILTPFLSTGAVIKEVPGKNCLIISDTDENIQRLLQIVNIFDDDVFRDVKVELFVFKNLSVKDVVEDLRNTFPLFTAGNRDSLKIKYLPIERLNAILVVAPDEQFLRQFKKWVDIIDNVFEGAKPRIYVYPLQNSQAEHIMSILSQIFTGTGTSKSSSSQDKSTTTTTAKPTSSTSNSSLTSLMSSSTTKSTDSASTKSSSSSAVSAVTATNSILVSSETKIYYDDKLNSLIILALPKDYLYIEELIKKLDSVPRQVLIEALIIEINLSDALKYGVQWFLANKINVNNHQYTGATILEEGKAIGLVNPLFSATSGISYAIFNGSGLQALIQALSNETNLSVLSNPTILVSDNNEAKIQVGDKVPIVTSETNVTGTTSIQNQYQYQDTGVILKVKPQINDSGLVKLDVTQEVSDVQPTVTTTGVNSPTINVRSVTTNLVVQDGASIAIGGLIQDKMTDTRQGIPVLSQLPIIGGLFGYKDKEHSRTELMIIITPHVVKNVADAALMTDEFKKKLMGLKKMLVNEKSNLIPADKSPKSGSDSRPQEDNSTQSGDIRPQENTSPQGGTGRLPFEPDIKR